MGGPRWLRRTRFGQQMIDVVVFDAARRRPLQLYGGVVDAEVPVDEVEHQGKKRIQVSPVRGVHEYVGA